MGAGQSGYKRLEEVHELEPKANCWVRQHQHEQQQQKQQQQQQQQRQQQQKGAQGSEAKECKPK